MQLGEMERLIIKLSSTIFLYEQKLIEMHKEIEALKAEKKEREEEQKQEPDTDPSEE